METLQHSPDIDRVRSNTWPELNERLDAQAAARVLAAAKGAVDPSHRIIELDDEWDFDRVLEAEASVMGLAGLALGLTVHRGFLILPGFVAAMVLLHATHGWYPLLPIFRRAGVRTGDEIDRERYALKALRGDFKDWREATDSQTERAAAAWQAVCA